MLAVQRAGTEVGLHADDIVALLETQSVRVAIETQVQKFAREISATTWYQVQAELSEGIRDSETLAELTGRVAHTMSVRSEQARTIARTEVTRATTTGRVSAFVEAGVDFKRWNTVGDADVRDSHVAVNGVTVPVGDMFVLAQGMGFGPGRIGSAAEDINCRCWLTPVRDPNSQIGGMGRILQALGEPEEA